MKIEHPDIVCAMMTGYGKWEGEDTLCPVCGKACNYIYVSSIENQAVGCDCCLIREYADEYMQ